MNGSHGLWWRCRPAGDVDDAAPIVEVEAEFFWPARNLLDRGYTALDDGLRLSEIAANRACKTELCELVADAIVRQQLGGAERR